MKNTRRQVGRDDLDQFPKVWEEYAGRLSDMRNVLYDHSNWINNKEQIAVDIEYILNIEKPDDIAENLHHFFELADDNKNLWQYGVANKIWEYIYYYAIAYDDPNVEFEYEYADYDEWAVPTEGYQTSSEINDKSYHGLAVLKYNHKGHKYYLNMPAPFLSAKAMNIFVHKTNKIVPKRVHNRNIVVGEKITKNINIDITDIDTPSRISTDTKIFEGEPEYRLKWFNTLAEYHDYILSLNEGGLYVGK